MLDRNTVLRFFSINRALLCVSCSFWGMRRPIGLTSMLQSDVRLESDMICFTVLRDKNLQKGLTYKYGIPNYSLAGGACLVDVVILNNFLKTVLTDRLGFARADGSIHVFESARLNGLILSCFGENGGPKLSSVANKAARELGVLKKERIDLRVSGIQSLDSYDPDEAFKAGSWRSAKVFSTYYKPSQYAKNKSKILTMQESFVSYERLKNMNKKLDTILKSRPGTRIAAVNSALNDKKYIQGTMSDVIRWRGMYSNEELRDLREISVSLVKNVETLSETCLSAVEVKDLFSCFQQAMEAE